MVSPGIERWVDRTASAQKARGKSRGFNDCTLEFLFLLRISDLNSTVYWCVWFYLALIDSVVGIGVAQFGLGPGFGCRVQTAAQKRMSCRVWRLHPAISRSIGSQ